MELSGKVLEKMAKDQAKEREEKQKAMLNLIKKVTDFFIAEDFRVSEIVSIVQVLDKTLQEVMQSKTKPIIKEWNDKTFKEFYAPEPPKEEVK